MKIDCYLVDTEILNFHLIIFKIVQFFFVSQKNCFMVLKIYLKYFLFFKVFLFS